MPAAREEAEMSNYLRRSVDASGGSNFCKFSAQLSPCGATADIHHLAAYQHAALQRTGLLGDELE